MKKIAIFLVVLVIAIGLLYSLNSKTNLTKVQAVNFGAILSLSGYGASDGESIKNGLELAKKDLANENITVDINYFDDATDPKQVVAGIQYMKSKNIAVVFGPVWSYLGDAALGVIGGSNITLLAPSMTSELVQTTSPQILFGQTKNATKLASTISWMKENNIKKPAIIVNQGSWGGVHDGFFAESAKNTGGIAVLREQVGFGKEKETIPTLILKAKSLGADAVLWAGSNDGEVVIVAEMQKLGMKIPFFADEEVMTAFNTGLISKNIGVPVYTWEKETNSGFPVKYKAVYGKEPNHYADAAYDMLMAVGKTVSKNGHDSLKANLNSLNYKGYAGTYQFDTKGDISGGAWKVIKVTNNK